MAKEALVEMDGTVTEVLPDSVYRVALENGFHLSANIVGKMPRFRIPVATGDKVKTGHSPFGLSEARVSYCDKD